MILIKSFIYTFILELFLNKKYLFLYTYVFISLEKLNYFSKNFKKLFLNELKKRRLTENF